MSKKSKYETHIYPRLDEIKMWRAQRLTIPEIAKRLSVGLSTLNKERFHPELEEALKAPELTEKEKQKQIRNATINHKKYYNSTLSFVRRHADPSERLKILETLAESVDTWDELEKFKNIIEKYRKN